MKYSAGKSFSNPALKCRMWRMMMCIEWSQRKYSLIFGEIKGFFFFFFPIYTAGHAGNFRGTLTESVQMLVSIFSKCWSFLFVGFCIVLFCLLALFNTPGVCWKGQKYKNQSCKVLRALHWPGCCGSQRHSAPMGKGSAAGQDESC